MAEILGDSLSWLMAANYSIASCATERKFELLLPVLLAGVLGWDGLLAPVSLANLLGGSTFGACGGGVGAGGSTLGAATLGSILGGTTGSGSLYERRGGGGSGDGRGPATVRPYLANLIVRCRERRGWGCGGWLAGGADCETGIFGTAAASENIWLSCVSSASRDSWR